MSDSQGNPLVWVTGASSGLGHALARLYAKDGAQVIASARSQDKLQALAALVDTDSLQTTTDTSAITPSGSVSPLPMDVTDDESITSGVKQMLNNWGVPDTVILNAGYYDPCSLDEITLEHFEKTIDVNYRGVVRCLLAVLPMIREKALTKSASRPHLVIVSSVAGYTGLPRAAAYGSTKAALTNLAESMKHELNAAGIDISVVNPGFVKTPLTDLNEFPMPFIMELEDAARAMHSGIASRKFEITFPKRFTWIMKFLRILPYPVYFLATKKLL